MVLKEQQKRAPAMVRSSVAESAGRRAEDEGARKHNPGSRPRAFPSRRRSMPKYKQSVFDICGKHARCAEWAEFVPGMQNKVMSFEVVDEDEWRARLNGMLFPGPA